jgi:hypothetical protein
MTAGSASTAASAPHYNGQNSVSPPAGQANAMGSSSGTMGAESTGMKPSSSGQMAATHVDSAMAHTAMSGGGYMALPENAEPGTYLRIASKAIGQHNKMLADDALSHAETRMLDRAVPASSGATADDSPGVTAIEHARQALASGDYNTAASDTRMAMHNRHGMMGGAGMGSGSDTTPMSGRRTAPIFFWVSLLRREMGMRGAKPPGIFFSCRFRKSEMSPLLPMLTMARPRWWTSC